MKKINFTPNVTTLSGIIEHFYMNPQYYESNYGCLTRFEPFWNTLSYADNEHYKGWYIKCAIVDVNMETGIQESYDTIWFDIKPYKDMTKVICQLGDGKIRFEIAGNLPKVMRGKEKEYERV